MEYAILIIFYIFVIVLDFIPILKAGKKNVSWTYFVILLSSIVVFILYVVNPKLLNMSDPISMLYEKISP